LLGSVLIDAVVDGVRLRSTVVDDVSENSTQTQFNFIVTYLQEQYYKVSN